METDTQIPVDAQLRLDALRQAVQYNKRTDGKGAVYAQHVVADAQEFYKFLIGEDE